jgi:hypothetical protein
VLEPIAIVRVCCLLALAQYLPALVASRRFVPVLCLPNPEPCLLVRVVDHHFVPVSCLLARELFQPALAVSCYLGLVLCLPNPEPCLLVRVVDHRLAPVLCLPNPEPCLLSQELYPELGHRSRLVDWQTQLLERRLLARR